eukprot:COSAG02_NODE_64197_length_261_cov_0.635802_1_plen_59_part_01
MRVGAPCAVPPTRRRASRLDDDGVLDQCQYPQIAEQCLSGMADVECACGLGLGDGPIHN